jgi:hypothetical protein
MERAERTGQTSRETCGEIAKLCLNQVVLKNVISAHRPCRPAFATTTCGEPVALLSYGTAISRVRRLTVDSRRRRKVAPFGIYTPDRSNGRFDRRLNGKKRPGLE